MIVKQNRKFIILTLAILIFSLVGSAGTRSFSSGVDDDDKDGKAFWGPQYSAQAQNPEPAQGKRRPLRMVKRWNQIAIDASGLDHTPVAAGEKRTFGEQIGPCRAARAIAIVHIAIFDAMNAIEGKYESYTGLYEPSKKTSNLAAIAQAAHDTLVAMFPSQKAKFDQKLAEDLSDIAEGKSKRNGIALGKQAAFSILALRDDDGSQHPEPRLVTDFTTSNDAGKWRQDPVSLIPVALGAHWNQVKPFVMQSASQFRVPAPPAMNSAAYATAYNEAKRLGGDGINTPTERTADQTAIGIYWAYDGTPSLCAPPRLYNQIAVQIAEQMGSDDLELARLLALANVAMADAGLAIWESKYFHNCWRPVTGIREADAGTGPTGMGDDNPATVGDPTFMPLGAPASNLTGPNFTPPFPAYPSGHAGFGGALFQTLRKFYGRDNVAFTFVSDELNGVTRDRAGNVRPLMPRSFTTFSQAEEENGQSRIYLGIHWSYDKTEGIAQGRKVADYVFDHAFAPLP
jgi:hypothetical protein